MSAEHDNEGRAKRAKLARGFLGLVSPVARLWYEFEIRAEQLVNLPGLPEMKCAADFVSWVDRVTQKAHLIGYDESAMSREAVFRLICMNSIVKNAVGRDYEPEILQCKGIEELCRVLEIGLQHDFQSVGAGEILTPESSMLCHAYVEQIHALGIWP